MNVNNANLSELYKIAKSLAEQTDESKKSDETDEAEETDKQAELKDDTYTPNKNEAMEWKAYTCFLSDPNMRLSSLMPLTIGRNSEDEEKNNPGSIFTTLAEMQAQANEVLLSMKDKE